MRDFIDSSSSSCQASVPYRNTDLAHVLVICSYLIMVGEVVAGVWRGLRSMLFPFSGLSELGGQCPGIFY